MDADSRIQRIIKWTWLTRNIAITYSDDYRCIQLNTWRRCEQQLEKSKIGDGDNHHDYFSGCLERCEARGCISEAVKLHAHPVHKAKVEATDLAVLIALVTIVDDASGLEGSAEATDG